ncbi:MAG TPA: phage protein Gp27 family protein [Candidatus Binataceae bacterium]|nr:phage protein Gp27 family protein [Candidatus Binataceae bacterium]
MPRRSKIATLPATTRASVDAWLSEHGFGSYRELQAQLRERGVRVSRASLQRYGARLEHRLDAMRAVTEQAQAIVAETDASAEAEIADAMRRLVQGRLFETVLSVTAAAAPADGAPPDFAALTHALAELERARLSAERRADALELRMARAAKQVNEIEADRRGAAVEPGVAQVGAMVKPPPTLAELRATLMGVEVSQ